MMNILFPGGQNGSVRVMDLRKESEDSSCVWKYQPHNRDVTKLAFAPWKLVSNSVLFYRSMYIECTVAVAIYSVLLCSTMYIQCTSL